MVNLRAVWGILLALALWKASAAQVADEFSKELIDAAKAQIGVTVIYDGAYVALDYPMGDVERARGVCTDVVIRALRDAHGIDLQQLVHEDMKANFSRYPQNWGLRVTDANIDHRRVPNLERYFERHHEVLAIGEDADYQPGDIVTWRLPGNLPHIGIVSEERTANGSQLIVHNIGRGTQLDPILFTFEQVGHYRWRGDSAQN